MGRKGLQVGHFARFKYMPDANQRARDREHDAEYEEYKRSLNETAKAHKKSENSPGCFCFGWFKKKDNHASNTDSDNETFIVPGAKGAGYSRE